MQILSKESETATSETGDQFAISDSPSVEANTMRYKTDPEMNLKSVPLCGRLPVAGEHCVRGRRAPGA